MSETLKFTTKRIEIPITVDQTKYTLKEATGGASVRYRNALISRAVLGPEGKPTSVRNIADTEPFLIHLCLYDKDNNNVKEDVIKSWPNRVQKALFEKAKEISHLDDDIEGDEVKNEEGATTDGSA